MVDWAKQHRRLVVLNALSELVERQPERFTGIVSRGSGDHTVYVVDPTVLDEEPFTALAERARVVGIDLHVVPGRRSHRELYAIRDNVMRSELLPYEEFQGAMYAVDTATSRVHVTVAAPVFDAARALMERFGDVVEVLVYLPEDCFGTLQRFAGDRTGWPVPTLDPEKVAGLPADAVAQRYRDEGFEVETYRLGFPATLHQNLNPSRIRMVVDGGRVVDAAQS